MHPEGRIVTRPFAIGFLMTFLLYFAIGAGIPLLPRLVTNGLGGDRADVGRLAAAFSAAAILCRPLLSLASRRGTRMVAVSGAALSAAGFGLLWHVPNLGVLALARVLAAVGEAFVWTAFGTLATSGAPEHRQAEAVSLSSVAIFLAIGLGPMSTESLARAGRFDAAALVPLVAAALAFAVSLLIRPEWTPAPRTTGGRLTGREIFHPGALIPGAVLGLLTLGWSSWSNFVALRADEVGMRNAAILFTAYSVVSLCIRLFGAKLPERLGLVACGAGATVFVSLGLLTLSAAGSAPGLLAGAVVIAVGVALAFPALSALALRAMREPEERTQLLSSFGMFFEVGTGIGGLVIGPIARNAGLPVAFRAGAVAPALGLVVLLSQRRRFAGRARAVARPDQNVDLVPADVGSGTSAR